MPQTTQTGFYPSTAQNAQNYINIVRRNFTPSLVYQNVRKAKPFLRFILENCAKERTGGYSPITQPVTFQNFGADGALSDWTGAFNLPGITNPVVNAEWNQALYVQPVAFTLPELSLMEGKGSDAYVVIDIIKARLYDKYQSVLDQLSSYFLGTGTANNLSFLGIKDAIDAGTNAATYGGLSRTTYSGWNSTVYANNQSAQVAYLQFLYYIMSFLQDTSNPLPTLGLCSYSVFYAVMTSFTTIERMVIQDPKNMDSKRGYEIQALDIGGIPLIVDPNLTGTTSYWMNTDHLTYYYNSDFHFKMTDLADLQPIGQLGFVQALTVAGQFVSDLPSAHFALTSSPSTTLA